MARTAVKGGEPATSQGGRETLFRAELKESLWGEGRKAYDPRFIRAFGPAAGLFLSQLYYWEGKGWDPDGWVYKSRNEMQEEIGLSRRQQDNARRILRAKGVLEERYGPGPDGRRKLFYRLDLLKLMEIVATSGSSASDQVPEETEAVTLDQNSNWPGNSEPPSRHDSSDPTSWPDNSEPHSQHSSSDPTIHREPHERTTKSNDRELTLQVVADDFSSRPTTAPMEDKDKTFAFVEDASSEAKTSNSEENLAHGSKNGTKEGSTTIPGKDGTAPPRLDPREANQVYMCLDDPDTLAGQLVRTYLREDKIGSGAVKLQEVAEIASRELTGSPQEAERYIDAVGRFVEELKKDEADVDELRY